MAKLVQLPIGDWVNPDHVIAVLVGISAKSKEAENVGVGVIGKQDPVRAFPSDVVPPIDLERRDAQKRITAFWEGKRDEIARLLNGGASESPGRA